MTIPNDVRPRPCGRMSGSGNLWHRFSFHERLAAESGNDRHDQKQVDLIQKRNHLFKFRRWVHGETTGQATLANLSQSLPNIMARLDMHRDVDGARLDKSRQIMVGAGNLVMLFQIHVSAVAELAVELGPVRIVVV